jgi:hypothetical protein
MSGETPSMALVPSYELWYSTGVGTLTDAILFREESAATNPGVEPILMGCRLTVGRLTLDQLVGVRIPAPQPCPCLTASEATCSHVF